jgi:hypothetical protein
MKPFCGARYRVPEASDSRSIAARCVSRLEDPNPLLKLLKLRFCPKAVESWVYF